MNIVGNKRWFFLISAIFIIASVVSLVTFGLKPGIEFSSGSLMTIGFEQPVSQSGLKAELTNLGYPEAIIQIVGEGDSLLRLPELSDNARETLVAGLTTRFGNLQVKEFDSVSPIVATETTRNAGIAVAVAAVGILLYISWAFRKMPQPFRYGTCAVIALVHDVVISTGIISILGGIFGWQVDLGFVAGILAVIGYSINDTVVVFDRIRENLRKGISPDFAAIVNSSLVETLGRSFNTNLTTLFTLLALLLFVGASIRSFAVVMLVGATFGMFSSVFIAPNLLVAWVERRQQPTSQ